METKLKTYDSVIFAKFLLALGFKKKKVLNVTKVQKLLYIAYGYFLSKQNRLIINEAPKAWPYGPVFPRTRKSIDFSNVIPLTSPEFSDIKKDKEVVETLDKIIDKYSKYSATKLSEWSHSKGGPWEKTVKKSNYSWNVPINNDLIKSYFKQVNIL